jgi:CheY-like chemotaxis protein
MTMPVRSTVLLADAVSDNFAEPGERLQSRHRVLAANARERALSFATSGAEPGWIPLDVMMSGMDRHELFLRLRDAPHS